MDGSYVGASVLIVTVLLSVCVPVDSWPPFLVAVFVSHLCSYGHHLAKQPQRLSDSPPTEIGSSYDVVFDPAPLLGKGRTVILRCSAVGDPGNVDATFSWIFTRSEGTASAPMDVSPDGLRVFTREEGGVGELEIQDLRLSDAGNYKCMASNPLTSSVTADGQLQVVGTNLMAFGS